MTEDSEKRFQKVMDKLCRSPKPKPLPPSDGGGTNTRQKGRRRELGSREEVECSLRHAATAIGTREGGPPPCRPWDRGDLMKRMATFKAMTWFGKPKAIDPVNCARRGWVNVEMDTLSCEACGARLLFSTPSSWTLQQVEKAASVFSLKLDNGHKLLCPWIDNICEEALAFFPPTPPPALIEGYQERSAALLQLSALPVISSSAIDYMRSPQLEEFLAKSASLTYRLDGGMRLTTSSGSMMLDSVSVADTSSQYYQAHKIISLCGWEQRVLPYVVDCEDKSSYSTRKDKAADSSSDILCSQNSGFVIYSTTVSRQSDGEMREQPSLCDQCDPASVVLDCKLCGACVGLWAFTTIPRPLELFNLVESPEEDGRSGPTARSDDSTSSEKPLSLNLTIAGGPPPTKQNFKPRISLPIVTRHLRSAFGSNGDTRNHVPTNAQGMDQLNTQNSLEPQEGNGNSNLPLSSETSGLLKRKRSENEYSTLGGSSCGTQPCPNGSASGGGNTLSNEQGTGDLSSAYQSGKGLMHEASCQQFTTEANTCVQDASNPLSSEQGTGDLSSAYQSGKGLMHEASCRQFSTEANTCVQDASNPLSSEQGTGDLSSAPKSGIGLMHEASCGQFSTEANACVQDATEDMVQSAMVTEDAENEKSNNPEAGHAINLQPVDGACIATESILSQDDETCESSPVTGSSGICRQENNEFSVMDVSGPDITSQVNHNSQNIVYTVPESHIISNVEVSENLSSKDDTHTGGGDETHTMQSHESMDSQNAPITKGKTSNSADAEIVTACTSRNIPSSSSQWDDSDKFDPIRRHRPFCPWIAPMHGENMPGWKLTLRALVQDKCSPHVVAPPSFSDEVDDPIVSVRKLFTSPPSKRFRGAR